MDAHTATPLVPRWLVALLIFLFVLAQVLLNYGNLASGDPAWMALVNILLLSIPLGRLFFSIGLFVAAERQRRGLAAHSAQVRRLVYLTPRIAGVLLALFVSLFALDVFEPGHPWLSVVIAFLIHALPAIALAVAVAFAWRRPLVGAIIFLVIGIVFLRFLFPNPVQQFGNALLFSGPMLAVALLFWEDWKLAKDS